MTPRGIKYEDRTDYVYENTWPMDKTTDNGPGLLTENVRIQREWGTNGEAPGRKCPEYAKIRDEAEQEWAHRRIGWAPSRHSMVR